MRGRNTLAHLLAPEIQLRLRPLLLLLLLLQTLEQTKELQSTTHVALRDQREQMHRIEQDIEKVWLLLLPGGRQTGVLSARAELCSGVCQPPPALSAFCACTTTTMMRRQFADVANAVDR
jgi:hypothetical protein